MTKNQDRQARIDAILNFLLDVGAYFATVTGVLFSEYLPQIRQSIAIDFTVPGMSKVLGAAFIALLVSFFAKDGKRDDRPIRTRLLEGFAYGVMWSQVLRVIWG